MFLDVLIFQTNCVGILFQPETLALRLYRLCDPIFGGTGDVDVELARRRDELSVKRKIGGFSGGSRHAASKFCAQIICAQNPEEKMPYLSFVFRER